ncbi:hypothetical protein Tco_0183784 [Tanacetum coccineum]
MDTGTSSTSGSYGILKDATPRVDAAKKVVSPSMVEESVAKESPGVNTSDLGSNLPLPSQEANSAGNAPGKPSYANATGKRSRTKVKLHGVSVTAFSEDGLSAIATKLDTPLMLDSYTTDMCMQSWGRSSYARAMIELRADVELKDNIVAAMPKIVREGYYTCNIRVEYECKPPSRTPKGIPTSQKIGFKSSKQQVYQPVSKKSSANNGGNKKKNVEPTNEVSKSNSFDALNSVDNDVELGTNEGSTHFASQEANYSESSFWNAESSSPGKPLSKVDEDSEDEVALVDNDMANFLTKSDGYGTQNLLEQWKDSHDDYEYNPYDDDLYERQEYPEMLQAFCDYFDIKVRGRKKK